ncbi:hypothetical protein ACH6CV_02065 [Bacillota bacterium Meth-B3]
MSDEKNVHALNDNELNEVTGGFRFLDNGDTAIMKCSNCKRNCRTPVIRRGEVLEIKFHCQHCGWDFDKSHTPKAIGP